MSYQPFMPTEDFLKLTPEEQEHIVLHGTDLDISECIKCQNGSIEDAIDAAVYEATAMNEWPIGI